MRALVLSGGAVKGAYQIGVLKRWMHDEEIDYDIMCGVSVGALNVAGLAHEPKGSPRKSIEWLQKFWKSKVLSTESIHKRWFPFGRLHSLWRKSIYDSSPLKKLVKDGMSLNAIRSNGRKIAVGAVCLDTGEHYFATEDDDNFDDWILASASFPCFYKPVMINDRLWSDGGIVNVTPLGQAIRMGATEIDVIMCSNPWKLTDWKSEKKAAVPDQLIRMFTLMSDQIMKSDIAVAGLRNDLVSVDHRYKKVRIRLVMPENELVSDSLVFDPKTIQSLIELGYKDADNCIIFE